MKTLRFENLVGIDGKTVELDVPDHLQHNDAVRARASAFGKRVAAVNDLRQVESIEEVGELGAESGNKLFKEFGNEQARND